MELPTLLVSCGSGVLHLDPNHGTYRVLLPYAGAIRATRQQLFVARTINEQTRLDKHDRQGLAWMRRIPACFDTHDLALLDDGGIALCSTGTNQIIFLDSDGRELRRWSPDVDAEFDSWHLNALTVWQGRLFCTCFGRFRRFRGWCGQHVGRGLIVDSDSGQAVADGLSSPHDPYRLDDGWLVNDSDRSRLLFLPDRGVPRVIVEAPGFSRGLAVLPEHYAVGFSAPRGMAGAGRHAAVLLVERGSNRLLRTVPLPCAEIASICLAPGPDVLEGMDREQANVREHFGLFPSRGALPVEARAGSVEVLEAPRRAPHDACAWRIVVRLCNRGRAVWSTCHEPPVHVTYQVVNRADGILLPEGGRVGLPVPIYPGQQLTFPMEFYIPPVPLPPDARVRLTLVQETVAWWEASAAWTPAIIPVPR